MPNNKKKTLAKATLTIFLIVQFYGLSTLSPQKLESANLSSVSDTLSNNRLSFRGQVNGNHAANVSAIVLEQTVGNMTTENTSTGSASLMGDESVQIGVNNAPITLKTIESDTSIIMETGITNAVNDNAPVFSTVSAIHTVTFTPVTTVPDSAFRVVIPSTSVTASATDGIPDKNGFDFSASAPTVTCAGGTNMTFETGTATSSATSGLTIGGVPHHSFECRYRGAGGIGTAVTMTIGTPSGNKLINPSPANSGVDPSGPRYPGQADTYTFRVRQTKSFADSYAVLDESLGTIGIVEAVRVTATVAPTLTFIISGVAASTSTCGVNTLDDSTPTSVPFGTLTVNNVSVNHMAQILTVSTNAVGGYSVTASESAALTAFNVGTHPNHPTIADTACQSTPCTVSTAQDWTSASYTGFGYSLQDVAGDAVAAALEYNYNPGGGARTFNARPFGLTGNQIMSDTTTVDADRAYVCYRAVIAGSQAAGDYENYVVYIATATF